MDDLISRQDVIKAVLGSNFSACTVYGRSEEGMATAKELIQAIKNLPSAQPERKKGKWAKTRARNGFAMADCMECSACGHSFLLGDWDFEEAKDEMRFCYSCGADMRGGDDEQA